MLFVLTLLASPAHAAESTEHDLTAPAEVDPSQVDYLDLTTPMKALTQLERWDCVSTPPPQPIKITRPYPSEDGHFLATRIAPISTPFLVDEVSYMLFNQVPLSNDWGCDAEVTHEVHLYKGTASGPPPASPTPLRTMLIQQTFPSNPAVASITVDVQPAIRLNAGETLWVAVEMISGATNPEPASCPVMCEDIPAANLEAFWSNDVTTPYPWSSLGSFGITAAPVYTMTGRTPL